MSISAQLDQLHAQARANRWLRYFATFNRIALAAGFLPSGYVKIAGERFTDLSNNHPMGHYLEALFYTGYYYPFIGVMQMTAAILLLIPRTATLGAVIYFPIILNITMLTFAVRFDGSMLSAPLMIWANLYLLCWNYHKLKYIFPFTPPPALPELSGAKTSGRSFPFAFFAGAFVIVFLTGVVITHLYRIKPRNTLPKCITQCPNDPNPEACYTFCECVHEEGRLLDRCLEDYKRAAGIIK